MDLRTESPYWLMKNGFLYSYPSLSQSLTIDVVIMGGGITGSLIAYHLAKAGIPAIVVDKRKIGMGSTCASTALLQYEIDTPLAELAEYVGVHNASRSYLLCLEAIGKIEKIALEIGSKAGFQRRQSFYYASKKKDVPLLEKEFKLRKALGIDLDFWPKEAIETHFPFSAPAALMSRESAQIDAYAFTHELLQTAQRMGTQVFDDTAITQLTHHSRGIKLVTEHGDVINAKKLIIASGYESQAYLSKKTVDFNSSFAVVSEPFSQVDIWYKNCLIWETARPYLYMRTTDDNRVLVGGKDEPFYSPNKRDALTKQKATQLAKAFLAHFPDLPFRVDFEWAGTFAETRDGLPYIGTNSERPHTFFAMGFGGNGIIFSLLAAEIIRDALAGKANKDAKIFGFER
ncbi:NAD(P)/FAD-dependent oxidoreductase [Runella sp.]|uniref:NAD(P)/FAD-dependent oxidoreductase n=1 Tax=Runella sp. TaxID=1960881 RepID=UPI003D1481BB